MFPPTNQILNASFLFIFIEFSPGTENKNTYRKTIISFEGEAEDYNFDAGF